MSYTKSPQTVLIQTAGKNRKISAPKISSIRCPELGWVNLIKMYHWLNSPGMEKKKHAYKNRKRDVAADCFRAFPCKTERIKQKLAIPARFRCSSNTESIVTIELS